MQEPNSSNVVVAAQQFNPSVVSQLWLVRNEIVGPEDFLSGSVFADEFVNVNTKEFHLLVTPPQLQFATEISVPNQTDLIVKKLGLIVETLPHTPYKAAGLNFGWLLSSEDTGRAARGMFAPTVPKLAEIFSSDDSRFGAYMSKNIFDCRLRLDIRPVTLQNEEGSTELLHFAFNYNLNLKDAENPAAEITKLLRRWGDAKEEAKRIVSAAIAENGDLAFTTEADARV